MQNLKKKIKRFFNKKAEGSVSTGIKVLTSIVVGALLLTGLYGVVARVVLPASSDKVNSMFSYEAEGGVGGSGGDGGFGGGSGTPELVPSVEELQETYEFTYYSTMYDAVQDVNSGTIGNSADITEENKADAVAGIFTDDEGMPNVILMQDFETDRLQPNTDMIINLGGNTLSCTGAPVIDSLGGNLTIDGRIEGSTIKGANANTLQLRAGAVTLNRGNYINESNTTSTINTIMTAANLTINNANINGVNNGGNIRGITPSGSPVISIENTDITIKSTSQNHTVTGLGSTNQLTLSNSSINIEGSGAIFAFQNGQSGKNDSKANISNTSFTVKSDNTTGKRCYSILNYGEVDIDEVDIIQIADTSESAAICDNYKLNANNLNINTKGNAKNTFGIYASSTSTVELSNSYIYAEVTDKHISEFDVSCMALANFGTTTADNTTFLVSGPYAESGFFNAVSDGTYDAYPVAISSGGNITLNNCTARGMHAGMSSSGGSVVIDGGTYEGFGHGGIYFSGENTTSYVKNATIGECENYTGYADNGTNHAGFYMGSNNNITVYMDNCKIYGLNQPIVMRGSSGEENITLYISNSNIDFENANANAYIRIDDITHRLYIGSGNNFDVSNVKPAFDLTQNDLATVVVSTGDVYCQD